MKNNLGLSAAQININICVTRKTKASRPEIYNKNQKQQHLQLDQACKWIEMT